MAKLGKEVRFVLCDFGILKLYSPETLPSKHVVPLEEGVAVSEKYHPPDVTMSSQNSFDPFTFDVACLDGILCPVIGVHEFPEF